MITAMEIRNQQFSKSMRGYSEEEVKTFIVHLAQDYESLYSENAKLREKIQNLEYELDRYKKIESAMNNSLVLAQQTAEAVKQNAEKEAAVMLQQSKTHINEMLMVYQDVIKRLNIFNVELKGQLTSEMELLDKNMKKTDEMAQFFYGKDLRKIMVNLEKINFDKAD